MVEFFSDAVLKYKLKKKIKTAASLPKEPIHSFQNMAVILPLERLVDEFVFLKLASSLNLPTKNITLVVFSKRKVEQYSTYTGKLLYCARKEMGFWGSFNDEMYSFFNQKFDLLINFFSEKSVFAEFICASSSSKLRLGFSKVNNDLNDVVLDMDTKDTDLFLSEATKYLKAFIK